MIFNIEEQEKYFKNHIAKFTDYGNIKILDFKNPESENYRIRFLFEEDYCKLHISGDLGHLTATNYNNMTYGHFDQFMNNPGYFREKINCHDRDISVYDAERAVKDIKELFGECDIEEPDDETIDDILKDFDERRGIGPDGYKTLSNFIDDAWEVAGDIGKVSTGIISLYMLAFRLAQKQLKDGESE